MEGIEPGTLDPTRAVISDFGDLASPEVREHWRQPVEGNPAFAVLSGARRVLMLQGPVGPFFDRVSSWLSARGCEVRRVVFQGGDERDCRAVRPIRFTGTAATWPAFLGELLATDRPDCVVLFGQGRLYHKVALERARAIDLPVVVMEEGYFRPGYVTMELGGVNGYSTTLDRFEWVSPHPSRLQLAPAVTPMHFQKMAWHASQHYIALREERHRYPHYQHHRPVAPAAYAAYWIRSWIRKAMRRGPDRRLQQWLFGTRQRYYFVPLQLDGDSQITQHSPFRSTAEFVVEVLQSYARRAPEDTMLVFRQHPHARGGPGNGGLIRTLSASLGVAQRVHHMVEGDTPDLAEHSLGTILINSTVGLQALERGAPLIALGDAPYKQPAFTFTGDLDSFWDQCKRPDRDAAGAFLAQVKHLTQMPASVYALRSEPLAWPSAAGRQR